MVSTVLAVDVGATRTRIAVFRVEGSGLRMVERFESRTPSTGDGEEFARILASWAAELAENHAVDAAGVGTIGPLDLRKGVVTEPPNIAARNIPLKRVLEGRLGVPVRVVNDCVAAVYAEYLVGAGRGYRNVVYLTLSTGIGAGAVVDGHLLLGKDGNAHEVGHIVVAYQLPVKCGCGGMGHWEALAGGSSVWRLARLLAIGWRGPETELLRRSLEGRVTAEDVFKAYYSGDGFAKTVVDELIRVNAAGIASVINVYDPEVLVLGGSIVLRNRWIVDAVAREAGRYVTNRMPRITVTGFGDDVVLYGAALIAAKPPRHLLELQG